MAIFDKESTTKVNVGGGKRDVTYRHKFYQTFADILEEAGNDKTKQQNTVDKLNEAYEGDAKVTARNKYLNAGEGAKFKAIDDQLKAYVIAFKDQKKREPSELEQSKARDRITAAVMATFDELNESE